MTDPDDHATTRAERERTTLAERERSTLAEHERRLTTLEVQLSEVFRRLEKLEGVPADLADIKSGLAALSASLDGLTARLALVWSVVGLVLGGLVTAALSALRVRP